jgi:hypothetical protein
MGVVFALGGTHTMLFAQYDKNIAHIFARFNPGKRDLS